MAHNVVPIFILSLDAGKQERALTFNLKLGQMRLHPPSAFMAVRLAPAGFER